MPRESMSSMGGTEFETMRHGHKEGRNLSEEGREAAAERGRQKFEEIRDAEPGTVFYMITSNVGRAAETRNAAEGEVVRLAESEDDIHVASVQDRERILELANDDQAKIIVTEVGPTTGIGFSERDPSEEAFGRYMDLYRRDEDLIGLTWSARPEELAELKEMVAERVSTDAANEIDPKSFNITPEQVAMTQLRMLKRFSDLNERYFPGRPVKVMEVSHNVSLDFAAMAMMGRDINLETWKELGSSYRGFLEGASVEIVDGKLTASYREIQGEPTDIGDLLDGLKKKHKARLKEWGIVEDAR